MGPHLSSSDAKNTQIHVWKRFLVLLCPVPWKCFQSVFCFWICHRATATAQKQYDKQPHNCFLHQWWPLPLPFDCCFIKNWLLPFSNDAQKAGDTSVTSCLIYLFVLLSEKMFFSCFAGPSSHCTSQQHMLSYLFCFWYKICHCGSHWHHNMPKNNAAVFYALPLHHYSKNEIDMNDAGMMNNARVWRTRGMPKCCQSSMSRFVNKSINFNWNFWTW